MLLQMALFHCLLCLSNIPSLHVLHLYPFLYCWDILVASRVLAIVDSAAMNAVCIPSFSKDGFLWIHRFLLGDSRSGIAGSYASSSFTF